MILRIPPGCFPFTLSPLRLHPRGGNAFDYVLLEQKEDDQGGEDGQGAHGEDGAPVGSHGVLELTYCQGHGPEPLPAAYVEQGAQEVFPAPVEAKDGGGH